MGSIRRAGRRRSQTILAAAAGAAWVAAAPTPPADAALMVDVRAMSVNGNSNPVFAGGKGVLFEDLTFGDILTLGAFAQISGTNGINDETVADVTGSFASGTGGLLGNLSCVATAGFSASGSTNGSQNDFDSDGDLDVGTVGTSATGKFAGRAFPAAAGTPINANTSEIQVATLTFTVTSGFGSLWINFIPRQVLLAAVWSEDGVPTTKNPTTSTYAAGVPVTNAPEPASASLLALTAVGLLARRRSRQ